MGERSDSPKRRGIKKHLKAYGLGYALLFLFVTSLGSQFIFEVVLNTNSDSTPDWLQFLAHVFENLSSSCFQLLAFVLLTRFLYFRGSHESKDPPPED